MNKAANLKIRSTSYISASSGGRPSFWPLDRLRCLSSGETPHPPSSACTTPLHVMAHHGRGCHVPLKLLPYLSIGFLGVPCYEGVLAVCLGESCSHACPGRLPGCGHKRQDSPGEPRHPSFSSEPPPLARCHELSQLSTLEIKASIFL